ncbi:MAG: hypothetical protein P1Q69_19030 [Candidatus Thorarchaeota archaeon]|nr:hypothetical protein [Candidatus Thorarchaeota archaeon]
MFFTNDTQVPGGLPYLGVPIGNWTLLTELLLVTLHLPENPTIVDTSSAWGASWTQEHSDGSTYTSFTCSKADGAMNSMRVTYNFNTTTSISSDVEVTRGGGVLGLPIDNTTLMLIGAGIVVVIVVVVILNRR